MVDLELTECPVGSTLCSLKFAVFACPMALLASDTLCDTGVAVFATTGGLISILFIGPAAVPKLTLLTEALPVLRLITRGIASATDATRREAKPPPLRRSCPAGIPDRTLW